MFVYLRICFIVFFYAIIFLQKLKDKNKNKRKNKYEKKINRK